MSRPWSKPPPVRPSDAEGAISAFDERIVAEFWPQLELNSSYGLSDYRDLETVTGSGAISAANGQFKLTTGATATSTAKLETAERGRYQPGIEALASLGIRRPDAPTGNEFWQAGYYDDDDGVMLGEDATGVYVRLRVGGSDKSKVYQGSWNADTADGSGLSGLTLDLTKPTVIRFRINWYFSGPIRVFALLFNSDNESTLVNLHNFGPTAGEPIFEQSTLPVAAEVDNGGDATSLDLFIGGRQFSVTGRYAPNRRITSQHTAFGASIGTSLIPLVSFRRKSGERVSVKIAGASLLASEATRFALILDGSLTGASWGAPSGISADETKLEADTSASAISGGNVVYSGLVAAGQGNELKSSGIEELGLDIPEERPVTLAAISASTSNTITAVLRMEEEW